MCSESRSQLSDQQNVHIDMPLTAEYNQLKWPENISDDGK